MAIAQRGPLPDHRHPAPDAGDPGELPVGDLPAQPRRADARDGDRQRARLSVGAPTPPTGARGSISASAAASRRCWSTTGGEIELMNGLLLSMPGTPVIYYGDEIGMGDNIYLGDRDGVRTPMQWSPDRNGGFSRADPARLVLPPIMDPLYGYRGGQRRGAGSRPALAAQLDAPHASPSRRQLPGVRPRQLAPPLSRATARSWPICASTRATRILCVANLSRTAAGGRARPRGVRRPRAGRAGRRLGVPADRPAALSADAAALRLLLVPARRASAQLPAWHVRAAGAVAGVPTHRGARRPRRGAAEPPGRRDLEREVLPAYLAEAALVRRQGRAAGRRAHRVCRAAAGARPRRAARRSRRPSCRTRSERYVAAARDRVGGRDRRRRCRSSSRWRACGAAGASAC